MYGQNLSRGRYRILEYGQDKGKIWKVKILVYIGYRNDMRYGV